MWLKKLFGGKAEPTSQRLDDQVWMNRDRLFAALANEVEPYAEDESVLVLALRQADFDTACEQLARFEPKRCADIFARETLRASLATSRSVAVAMPGALPADMARTDESGIEILVLGRNATRAADEALEQFADSLGRGTRIVFHLSLDDELLRPFSARLKPMLEKLGMKADEPISSPLVTRAIRNAQQ